MYKKSLNVNDSWFGFYNHFKKGIFALPYDHHRRKWVNISNSFSIDMLDKRRIDIYFIQEFVTSKDQAS